MTDLQAIADRVEIEALRGEFTDALMMRDRDRFASLFTDDGAWRMPHIDEELVTRAGIRAGVERLRGLWEFFVQTVHPAMIRIEGDTAVGRSYIDELGRFHEGSAQENYLIYYDCYRRTSQGWRFASRVYEVRYFDSSPLPGSRPR
jgi:ketosteroid isomerase-like protein